MKEITGRVRETIRVTSPEHLKELRLSGISEVCLYEIIPSNVRRMVWLEYANTGRRVLNIRRTLR